MQIMEKFTKRKFFFKLVTSFVVLSLLIVLCISILFASVYIKDIRKQITDEYLGSLERASVNLENITREIDQLYTYMQLNLDIYVFLNQSENNAEAENAARIQAKLISQINPYIRSVQLYNAKTESLITVGKQDFVIQSIKNIGNYLETKKDIDRNILLTKLDKSSADNSDRTISIVYTEDDMNDMLANMIIVDLEEQQLRREILDRYEGETLLIGSDGTLYSYSDEKPDIFDVKEEDYFKTVSKMDISKGSFLCTIDGERKTVTYHKNNWLNCFIVNIRPYGSIISEIQQKRNFIIVLSLLVILVFSVFSFILSKKIYNPIRKISEVFQDSKYGSSGGYSSEVSLIMDVFRKTESQLEVLENKNKNNVSQIKEFYLRQMLRNGQVGAMSEQDLQNYGIEDCFNNAIIIDIKIDNYYQIEKNERYKYERSICNQCHIIFDDDFYGEFINMFDGQIVAVLRYKDKKCDYSMINNIFDKLKNSIKNDLNITVTIGVGSVINSFKEFSEAFAQAQDMTKHRFIFGGDRVIYRQMVDTKLSENYIYPAEIADSLIDSIRVNNAERFIEYQSKFINILKNYPYQDASEIFFGVALNCIRTINAIVGNNNGDICFNIEEFNRVYFELETLEQAGEWLQNLFNEYRSLLESLKSNKHFLVIEDAKKYIDEHLSDINLCVELLAEKAGYTPNYFAKIFKEITGVYINNYIRQMRINKAKLLLENNCKIGEIPGMVGFANLSHFYVAFKKDAGLTPASYQNFAMQQKSN